MHILLILWTSSLSGLIICQTWTKRLFEVQLNLFKHTRKICQCKELISFQGLNKGKNFGDVFSGTHMHYNCPKNFQGFYEIYDKLPKCLLWAILPCLVHRFCVYKQHKVLNTLIKCTFSQVLHIKMEVFISRYISSEVIKYREIKEKGQFSVAWRGPC